MPRFVGNCAPSETPAGTHATIAKALANLLPKPSMG